MKRFRDEVEKLPFQIGEKFYQDVERYIETLTKWNRVHNLTRMDRDEIYSSIIDSIYPFQFVEFSSLLDIGSGAGFPAIPIALLFRDRKVVLVEPIKKKSSFLYYLKSALQLSNISIFSKRIEDITLFPTPDLITSRAVSDVPTLLEITKHLHGSKFLFYKGSKLEQEIEGLQLSQSQYRIFEREYRKYLLIEI